MDTGEPRGDDLWRGGHRIEIEKQPEVITVMLRDEQERERLGADPAVMTVEPVFDGIHKARVAPGARDDLMERVRASGSGIVVHHAYSPAGDDATRYYLTDRINAKFAPGLSGNEIEAALERLRLRILRRFPAESGVTLLLQVTDETGMNPVKAANALAGEEGVEWAEPDLVNRYAPAYVPSDPMFGQQWHLRSAAGPQVVAGADVSAVGAWDITRGSRSVVVALIDDGFDLSHPDFTGTGKVVHPKDYVDGDANPFPSTVAGDYHGTPCAGVAIGEENGAGTVGIAPGCAFMPVRFPLTASDSLLWDIFDFVGARADVISCSWGPPPVYAPLSQLMSDKFHELHVSGGPRKKGCLVFFAAGNDNAPLNDPANIAFQWRHPQQGLRTTTGPILSGEAAHPDNVAVSASTSQNRKSAYSSWGAEIDVCAPSNNFHPLNPQQAVPGLGITTTDNEQHGQGFTSGSRFTSRFGGTSSATPLAAGVAALVISANPALTAAEVKGILQSTADKIIDNNPDIVLGHQKGTYIDGHSEWFGHGRVNAKAAVEEAVSRLGSVGPAGRIGFQVQGNLSGTGDAETVRLVLGTKLRIALAGPAGQDFDLYVKRDGAVSPQDSDFRGTSGAPSESILIDAAQPGEYQVLVHSYRGAGAYTLTVTSE